YQAIVNYNNAIARFNFAKGTMLQHDNVVIGEGPLPAVAHKRAIDHERERSHALVLREREAPTYKQLPHHGLPEIPTDQAPSLPVLMKDRPMGAEVPDQLPEPKKLKAEVRGQAASGIITMSPEPHSPYAS